MIKGSKKLENMGSQILTMPCNSAEYFFEDINKEITIPFFSMIEEVAKKIKKNKYKKIGLLATKTTIDKKLYDKKLSLSKVEIIKPKNQEAISNIISNILAGEKSQKDKEKLLEIIEKMKREGAETIILGCTDLPILINQSDTQIPLVNTIKILAEATIKFSIS